MTEWRMRALLCGAAVGLTLTAVAALNLFRAPEPSITVGDRRPLNIPPAALHVRTCMNVDLPHESLTPCVVVTAGGKRFLFGAPQGLDPMELGVLDAVFLFDGDPAGWLGILPLRYSHWRSEQSQPLAVIAGEVLLDTLQSLNDGLVVPDAQIALESRRGLDIRNAPFSVRPVPLGDRPVRIFDTGDVQVSARSVLTDSGDQLIGYTLSYQGESVFLQACGQNIEPDGEATILVQPTWYNADWSRALATARERGHASEVTTLLSVQSKCPKPTDLLERAEALGVQRVLVISTQGDTTRRPRARELNWTRLDQAGVLLAE